MTWQVFLTREAEEMLLAIRDRQKVSGYTNFPVTGPGNGQ